MWTGVVYQNKDTDGPLITDDGTSGPALRPSGRIQSIDTFRGWVFLLTNSASTWTPLNIAEREGFDQQALLFKGVAHWDHFFQMQLIVHWLERWDLASQPSWKRDWNVHEYNRVLWL